MSKTLEIWKTKCLNAQRSKCLAAYRSPIAQNPVVQMSKIPEAQIGLKKKSYRYNHRLTPIWNSWCPLCAGMKIDFLFSRLTFCRTFRRLMIVWLGPDFRKGSFQRFFFRIDHFEIMEDMASLDSFQGKIWFCFQYWYIDQERLICSLFFLCYIKEKRFLFIWSLYFWCYELELQVNL